MTINELEKIVNSLPFDGVGGLAYRLNAAVQDAIINASDTIHVERAEPISAFDRLAIASLESALCYSNDSELQDWFVNHGVNF